MFEPEARRLLKMEFFDVKAQTSEDLQQMVMRLLLDLEDLSLDVRLLMAVKWNLADQVKRLLSTQPITIDSKEKPLECDLLLYAAYHNNGAVFKHLVSHGHDVSRVDALVIRDLGLRISNQTAEAKRQTDKKARARAAAHPSHLHGGSHGEHDSHPHRPAARSQPSQASDAGGDRRGSAAAGAESSSGLRRTTSRQSMPGPNERVARMGKQLQSKLGGKVNGKQVSDKEREKEERMRGAHDSLRGIPPPEDGGNPRRGKQAPQAADADEQSSMQVRASSARGPLASRAYLWLW